MNRGIWVATAYGLACVAVGLFLIQEGASSRAGKATSLDPGVGAGDAGEWMSGPTGNALDGGSGGLAGLADVAGETEATEVGPDGIRFVAAEGEGGGAPAAVGRVWTGRRSAGWLPESGKELLALNDPLIQEVADSLTEAGVTAEEIETGLQGIYGHVLRLSSFRMYARLEVEGGPQGEPESGNLDREAQSRVPSLQWRSEVWSQRSREYREYLRRDLEVRMGIRDEAVVARLVEIAEAMAARDGGRGEPGSEQAIDDVHNDSAARNPSAAP